MILSENLLAYIDQDAALIDQTPRADENVLMQHGLCIRGGKVVSSDCERRTHWRDMVTTVATQDKPSLVMVRASPVPVFIGLARCRKQGVLQVYGCSDNVCAHSGFDKACRLLGLTPREQQVMSLLAAGDSIKIVAHETKTKPSTVRTHIKSLSRKTGCNGISSLIVFFATLPKLA